MVVALDVVVITFDVLIIAVNVVIITVKVYVSIDVGDVPLRGAVRIEYLSFAESDELKERWLSTAYRHPDSSLSVLG